MLRETVNSVVKATAELQRALAGFADCVDGEPLQAGTADALEQKWGAVRRQYEEVEAGFAELVEALEDVLDVADAQAALDEPGASIPWAQVKAELGRS